MRSLTHLDLKHPRPHSILFLLPKTCPGARHILSFVYWPDSSLEALTILRYATAEQ